MARINIPIDVLTSRLNFGERFSGLRSQTIGQRFANIKPVSEFFVRPPDSLMKYTNSRCCRT